MIKSALIFSLMVTAAVAPAQGPPPGGPGPWGHGGGGPGRDFGIISAGPGSSTPVTGAPYTAVQTTQSQQKLQDANLITRTETSKINRDSLGRVRIEHTSTRPGQAAETRVTIFDPVGGFSYVLDPANLTAVKMAVRVPPASGSGPHTGGRNNQGTTAPAVVTQTLTTAPPTGVNVPATGTLTTTTIPAGAIGNQQPIQTVRETWIATVLKVPVYIKTSDPRFGDSLMTVNVQSQAEPDPALFQVPSNYTITTRGNRGPMGMHQGMRQGGPRN